jgi:hypothetical protein
MKQTIPFLIILLLSGCAGKVNIIRPTTPRNAINNFKIIDKPRDAVWNSSVPGLGKQFFVINNLDKSSGFINVSYNGDPEKYVDCGRVTSYVKNARGERTYDFPGAKAQQQYEVMYENQLFFVNRGVSLEGRINLVFEEVSPRQTKVTANTRYIVQRQVAVTAMANNITQSNVDSISFNTGNSGLFAPNKNGQILECVATGALEQEILAVIN